MQQSAERNADGLGALAKLGWLAEQPEPFRARMLAAGRWVTAEPGRSLYDVGDDPDALYGLETGMVHVAIPVTADEQVTVHRAEPGFWVGDSAILAGVPRSISVIAATRCRLFRIPARAIHSNLADNPGDWQCFYLLSHLNATRAVHVVAEVLSLSPRARFARMLLRLADHEGLVRVTQEELASLAGMNRASFRRAFTDLIAAGTVLTEYGGVRVADMIALEAEAIVQ